VRTPNEKALLEWRKASLQEATAIKAFVDGRLSAKELRIQLRRAERTRMHCTAYLPAISAEDDQGDPAAQPEACRGPTVA
jgi:anti-sigma factor RsiW